MKTFQNCGCLLDVNELENGGIVNSNGTESETDMKKIVLSNVRVSVPNIGQSVNPEHAIPAVRNGTTPPTPPTPHRNPTIIKQITLKI